MSWGNQRVTDATGKSAPKLTSRAGAEQRLLARSAPEPDYDELYRLGISRLIGPALVKAFNAENAGNAGDSFATRRPLRSKSFPWFFTCWELLGRDQVELVGAGRRGGGVFAGETRVAESARSTRNGRQHPFERQVAE